MKIVSAMLLMIAACRSSIEMSTAVSFVPDAPKNLIALSIVDVRLERLKQNPKLARLEIKHLIKSTRGEVRFNSFHNDCAYSVSFNEKPFFDISPMEMLDSGAQERDWITLDSKGREFLVNRIGTPYPSYPILKVVLKLHGYIEYMGEKKSFVAISSPFMLKE
jgi:hypothetical protein